MSQNGRLSIVFLFTLLLYFATGELNNVIGGWSVYLYVDALLVIFFGIYITRYTGLLMTIVLAFLAESQLPVPTGTYFAGYLGLWLFFVWSQARIRRQNPKHLRLVAVAAQAIWMLGMALLLGREHYGEWIYWQRWAIDLVVSLAVIWCTVAVWCRFQLKLLYSLGWDIEAQATSY